MTEQRSQATIRFCLIFTLALALAAIGLTILFDYASLQGSANGRISLSPGGGVLSLLFSAALLALLFRSDRLASVLAIVTLMTLCAQVALPYISHETSPISSFAISPSLFAVIMLATLTLISAIHQEQGALIGRVSCPLVLATGLASLASHWVDGLQWINLGTIAESTLIVSPLVMFVGLVLPSLHVIRRRSIPEISWALILVAISSISLTVFIWHNMRIQNSTNVQNEAAVLVDQLAASTRTAFNDDMALIRRLAQRQQLLDGPTEPTLWTQEVQSYLNDFNYLRLIGLLGPDREPLGLRSRADHYLTWLSQFLAVPDNQAWLQHAAETGQTHLSVPLADDSGRMLAMVASPVSVIVGQNWHVFAIVDLEDIFRDLMQHYDGKLNARFLYDDRVIYDLLADRSGVNREPDRERGTQLHTRQLRLHHDSLWRVEIYTRPGSLPVSVLYLPPLMLFTGLTLGFLVILSHLFWRESERRSKRLSELNRSINAHLSREQSLRHSNERIMEFSRDILCSINASGVITSINRAANDILGYPPDQLIGQRFASLVDPMDHDSTADELNRLMGTREGSHEGFRNHLRHQDGHTVTLSWTAEWSEEDQILFCVGRDMTHQLAAEILVRERDQFFSLSPDMFCIVDLNSHFFEVNKAFETVLGYTREELLGASYMQLIHDEDRPRVEQAVESMLAGNTINDLHIRAISKDATERWLELSTTLSTDELIYVAARDTTEMRNTQARLQASERLLNIAERAAKLGGWVLHIDTGTLEWSHAMFEIHELPVGEAPTLEKGLNFYTPESRVIVTRAIETSIERGIPFDEELQIRTPSGRLRWVRAIGQAVKNEDGRIVQIQGGLQDITASHQAMEQIRRFAERQSTIFESITDAFFTVNQHWQFTYVNRRSEEILGLSKEMLLGRTLWDMFPGAAGSVFEEQYRQAMETGESVSFEGYYEPLDNWLEVSAYPSEEGLAVYYRSIKERKLAQQQLEQTMAELERSNRELQDFAFVASHDLQEPLRKIQAFSDRLLNHSDHFNDQEKDYLARMQSAAYRMQSLIQDLLTYSRVTTRAQPLVKCDTNRIMAEVLQDMETRISHENADIEISPLPSITGDATQVRQVFQNLLSNAIKFHQPGRAPKVRVWADNDTDQGWTLVIEDNGVGFDDRYADKLFLPFQRLHKQEFAGTGIGLAIVKKILDRHQADISVTSRINQGTRFHIHFPTNHQSRTAKHG